MKNIITRIVFLPLAVGMFCGGDVFVGAAPAVEPPAAFGPTPTDEQMVWHRAEMIGLICFGLNTYTDQEWGYGDVPAERFNPTALDARHVKFVAAHAVEGNTCAAICEFGLLSE